MSVLGDAKDLLLVGDFSGAVYLSAVKVLSEAATSKRTLKSD